MAGAKVAGKPPKSSLAPPPGPSRGTVDGVFDTRTRVARLVVGPMLWAAACSEPDAEPPSGSSTTASDESTGGGESFDREPADHCVAAPKVGPGRHTGTLRGKISDRNGACGRGGPDAYVVVDIPRRADVRLSARGVAFVPVVGARSNRCELSWAATQRSCTQGLEGWVLDMPAGSTLLVAVGIDPDDPALASSPTPELPDPLGFRLDVELRNVLLAGDPCVPASRGRCVSGTACLPVEDDPELPPAMRCVTLSGDTCASAISVPIEPGITTVLVDRSELHTDAHAHGCGGARRPERVLALALPPDLEPGAHLEVRADAPDVLLAIRGPGCAAHEELACAPDSEHGTVAVVEDLLAVGSPNLFLFIEYPRPAQADPEGTTGGLGDARGTETEMGELPPLLVEIELFGA